VLTQLRAALAAEAGGPVRVEVLARRLGTDPATLAAMLAHLRRRGLDPAACPAPAAGACHAGPPPGPAPAACRHCPLVVPMSRARSGKGTAVAADEKDGELA
jgi:FeoC-like transcriptional regulator